MNILQAWTRTPPSASASTNRRDDRQKYSPLQLCPPTIQVFGCRAAQHAAELLGANILFSVRLLGQRFHEDGVRACASEALGKACRHLTAHSTPGQFARRHAPRKHHFRYDQLAVVT